MGSVNRFVYWDDCVPWSGVIPGPPLLIAGWFPPVRRLVSARSPAHRGLAAFVRSRLLRLGAPLIAFTHLVDPVCAYLGGLGEGRVQYLQLRVTWV